MAIPFSLQRLDHVVLRVRDVAAMQAFYCDVLGCTVEKRQEAIGLLQLRAGDSLIDLVDVEGELGRMGGAAPPIRPSLPSTSTRSISESPARSCSRPIASCRFSTAQPRTSQ